MNIKSYPLHPRQWFPETTPKQFVVWHGTGGRTSATRGRATTSIDGWNADAPRVGAPWLVDRDGTIYRTFDDSRWAFHLGIKGSNGRYDRRSVAIEFANELDLTMKGSRLCAFGNTPYDGPFFTGAWRGATHFAEMDAAQVDAGIALTLDICRRYGIEPKFYHPSTRFDFPRCFEVATIVCHSNCRADKTDLFLPDWICQKLEAAGIRLVS